LSNSAGVVTDTYDYEAFGEVLNETGITDNNYKFTGEQFDPSLDQYYLRARYYAQGVGRFTQQDTYTGNSSDPVSLHKYIYGNADPVRYTDPTGNFGVGISGQMATLRIMGSLSSMVTATAGSSLSRVGAGLVGAGLGFAIADDNPLAQFFSAKVIYKDLAHARARSEARVKARAKGRRLLYHYTDRAGSIGISACQCMLPTSFKGATVDGLPRPTGAYATSIPPWSASATQSTISKSFYGGTDARVGRLGWFIAIDGSDFFPYGQPGEYVKSVKFPMQPVVPINIITVGPNPMALTP
jgi:RHS repeat-associated protein